MLPADVWRFGDRLVGRIAESDHLRLPTRHKHWCMATSTIDEEASDYQRQFAQAVSSRFIAACQRLRLGKLI